MNIGHSTSNIEHRTQKGAHSNVRRSTFDVGCPMFVFFSRIRSGHARSGHWSLVLCASMLLVMTCGCQSPRAGKPLAAEHAGSDADAQMEFWHTLTEEPIATNDHAFHGLLLYMDGKDESA